MFTQSAPKLLAFDDSDIEDDDDACNVPSTSTPSKPLPSSSNLKLCKYQEISRKLIHNQKRTMH